MTDKPILDRDLTPVEAELVASWLRKMAQEALRGSVADDIYDRDGLYLQADGASRAMIAMDMADYAEDEGGISDPPIEAAERMAEIKALYEASRKEVFGAG